eukprot:scaffold161798_cov43-Tisochrysis_lutea.AAC.1
MNLRDCLDIQMMTGERESKKQEEPSNQQGSNHQASCLASKLAPLLLHSPPAGCVSTFTPYGSSLKDGIWTATTTREYPR